MSLLEQETEKQREVWRDEIWKMKSEVAAAQKKMEAARANNHKTLIRNQQLREKLVNDKLKLAAVQLYAQVCLNLSSLFRSHLCYHVKISSDLMVLYYEVRIASFLL